MSLSVSLQTALQSLLSSQTALSVAAHNTANAQNAGYSRQVARLRATRPIPDPSMDESPGGAGQLGTGVSVAEISRQYDSLLAAAIRANDSQSSYQETLLNGLTRAESLFNEPSGSGMDAAVTSFLSAFSDLAASPDNSGARAMVLESARSMLAQFQSADSQLEHEQNLTSLQMQQEVSNLNADLQHLADLNEKIASARASGMQPNDYLDDRDATLREVSQSLTVQVTEQSNGTVAIAVGGHELVSGNHARQLCMTTANDGTPTFVLDDTGAEVPLGDGTLAALRDFTSYVGGQLRTGLSGLLNSFVQAVNAQHQQGVGLDGSSGTSFFVSVNGEWQVNSDLLAHPERIAASASGATGDGTVAATIAGLGSAPQTTLNGQNVLAAYQAIVSDLGARVQGTRNAQEAFAQVGQSLSNQRDSISGVSTDQEMVDVMRFQQAYTAAAKVIQTVDSMVADLMNRVGS